MGLSMDDINKQYLPNLYYNKYQYKASFTLDTKVTSAKLKNVFTASQDEKFLALAGYIHKHKDDIRVRVEHKSVSIFSNDLSILQKLRIPKFIHNLMFFHIIQTGPVKLFKNPPKYNYRVYTSDKPLNREDIETLKQLKKQFNLKFSAGLEHAICYNRWWFGKMFIDYNKEEFLTYGGLVLPTFLKKHHKLDWIGNKYKYIVE